MSGENGDAPSLMSPALAGVTNRALVLETLHRHGPQSRAWLAHHLAVSRKTVGAIVSPLIASGTLVEHQSLASGSSGGKPATPIWFREDGPELGAICLLPRTIEVARVSLSGQVRARREALLPQSLRTRDHLANRILEIAESCFGDTPLHGIGIAAGGIIDRNNGTIIRMYQRASFADFPIGPVTSKRFSARTVVERFDRSLAFGDLWFGAGRGENSFASIETGPALGVGLVQNGTVFASPGGAGGEAGHMTVDLRGTRCRCGKHGCWHTVATERWLRDEASKTSIPSPAHATTRSLVALAEGGSRAARELVDRYADNLAIGLANIQQLVAPGLFIVHGDAATGDETFRARLESRVRELSPKDAGLAPRITLAKSDTALILGCAALVLRDVLADGLRQPTVS